IAQLRKALDDDAKDPSYIETVSRTGYRLIAAVETGTSNPARKIAAPVAAAAALIAALALTALVWIDGSRRTAEPAVAVLPFDNLTGNAALDYVGDGVAEEIIATLTRVPPLRVRARNQSFRFRDAGKDVSATADELDVRFIVAGSVRQDGTRLRVTARLVDTRDSVNLWTQTEEHDVLELFEGQDAISRGVAEALAAATGVETVEFAGESRYKPLPEAYDLYLRGRHIWHRRGNEPLQPAIDLFREAVRIDPDFGRGWGALATAYLTYPSYSAAGRQTWYLAEEAAQKALELDPDIPEAYGVLATFAYTRQRWRESESLYLEGIRRDERSATAHYWYGEFLAIVGKQKQSVEQFRRTLELDPTYQPPQLNIAFAKVAFRDFVGARAQFRDLWQRGHRTPLSWMGNFMSSVLTEHYDEASDWIDGAEMGDDQKALLRRFVAIRAGEADDAALGEDLMTYFWRRPDYPLAVWMGGLLGAADRVLALLNARLDNGWLVEPRPLWAPGVNLDDDPGFEAFLERMGLINYWDASGWSDVCRRHAGEIRCDAADLTPETLRRILEPAASDENAPRMAAP
ncbi:MAG: hypothetical protein R3315_01360, partial [Woeseiaceae bacterium]|nr:hypothetical protein [Woeseiaceae bacterium]